MARTWTTRGPDRVGWGPPQGFPRRAQREPGRPCADARLSYGDGDAQDPVRSAPSPVREAGADGCPGSEADNKTPGGTGCPPTGAPATAIARDRRSAAGPVAGGLAVVGPVSRDLPGDCSPRRFGSECRPPRARFRIDVRHDLHKGLIHQLAARQPNLSTNVQAPWRSVEKSRSAGWRAQARLRRGRNQADELAVVMSRRDEITRRAPAVSCSRTAP